MHTAPTSRIGEGIREIPFEWAPGGATCLQVRKLIHNRTENSHQPTRERERRMGGFRDPERMQAFLSSFGPIRQHFALKRHLLCASRYRKQLAVRFDTWHRFTELTQNPSASLAKAVLFALVHRRRLT